MAFLLQQPDLGKNGGMTSMRVRLVFGDDGVTFAPDFTLPAGTLIEGIHRKVTAVFDGSGTDLLQVGTVADPDRFVATGDTDLTSLGDTRAAAAAADTPPFQLAADQVLQFRYDDQNGDATTGSVDVTVLMSLNNV